MPRRNWWQRPQLRTDEDEGLERKVGWLELFFDLYFVVVIAQLSHHLAENVSWSGVGEFIFLFLPVWWIWVGSTYYIERFETEGIEHRLMVFAQMIPIAGLAVFAKHGLGDTSIGYGLSFAIARSFQIYLWWRAGYHDAQFRPTAKRFVTGFSIGVGFFYLSCLVPPPLRFLFWGLGLTIDMLTPTTTLKLQEKLPTFSSSKLPERYGLFIIIVLGESVVGVVSGLADQEQLSPLMGLAGILGILLAFGIWWIYFDFVGRRGPKPGMKWRFSWGYGHLPLALAITATGAGILNIIAAPDLVVSKPVALLISFAIALALTMMGLLELCLDRSPDEPTHPQISPSLKFAGAGVAAGLGLWSHDIHVIALELLLFGLLAVQMGYGVYVWFTQELEPEDAEPLKVLNHQ